MPRRTRPLPRKRSDKISTAELMRRFNSCCYSCGCTVSTADASRDHLNPKSNGGRFGRKASNVVLMHEACNRLKGSDRGWI